MRAHMHENKRVWLQDVESLVIQVAQEPCSKALQQSLDIVAPKNARFPFIQTFSNDRKAAWS